MLLTYKSSNIPPRLHSSYFADYLTDSIMYVAVTFIVLFICHVTGAELSDENLDLLSRAERDALLAENRVSNHVCVNLI